MLPKAERTSWVAEKIQKEFGEDKIEVVPIEQAWQNDFAAYDCFIVGASTWFDGGTSYLLGRNCCRKLRTMKLKGKKVAIFGLGDQIRYPENFADGNRFCWAEVFEGDEATLVGFYFFRGLHFRTVPRLYVASSGAGWLSIWIIRSEQAEKKIKAWCQQVKKEFA